MGNAYTRYNRNETPQSEPIPGRDQVQNAAGGYVFPVDKWVQLERFLILGTEGGTYYVGEPALTRENAVNVEACIAEDGARVVSEIVDVSDAGRAAKNDPALFALALAASTGTDETRAAALAALPKVARIPTHLFHFLTYVKQFRGIGRGVRTALAKWYLDAPIERLTLHSIKFKARDGWSNRDVLRLAHPKTDDAVRDAVFRYIVNGFDGAQPDETPAQIFAAEELRSSFSKVGADLIREYNLPRECVPTELLSKVEVWEALLERMPITATIRNLGKMTSIGLIKPNSDALKTVVNRLTDVDTLRKGRVHPIQLLSALLVYNGGAGVRGSLSWNPVQRVVDALDEAFYASFDLVEPTGKKYVLGIDVSSSMRGVYGGGLAIPGLTPATAAACMAMVTARAEEECAVIGFDHREVDVKISPRMRLDDVVQALGFRGGATDASIPFRYATQNKIEADAFVVYTDNESWAGDRHPVQALTEYRRKMNRPSKLAVVAMTATHYSVADQNDAGQMDFVGFDANAPRVLQSFVAEE